MKPIILYIDDDQANLDTFFRTFRFDYDVKLALSAALGLGQLKENPETAVIFCDQRMPGTSGTDFFSQISQTHPYPVRIMLTAFSDNEALLAAIQKGHVYDYVTKPWDKEALKQVIDRAVSLYQEKIEKIKKLKIAEQKIKVLESDRPPLNFSEIIGADGALSGLIQQIKKVAPSSSSVLIRGESGTGKELIARAIHNHSARSDGPFVKVNGAALSPTLLESELFGHEKGAFTGANNQKIGRFELADGGTLFLDEIGDLPESVQVKILRVLQEREIERVGGHETIKLDVRLITATHQNLEKRISEGKFREDLFYRINVIPLTVPPLRERQGDIATLAQHFVEKFSREMGRLATLSESAIKELQDYDWPGNVRELSNVIERAVVLSGPADGGPTGGGPAGCGQITAEDLSPSLVAINQEIKKSTQCSGDIRDDIQNGEAKELAAVMRKVNGNISEAARSLGVARSTLVHRLKKSGLI